MGCPLCKIAPVRKTSGITAYDYAKNFMTPGGSRSRQASVISQPSSVGRRLSSQKASLDSSDREPAIYFLSGSPALHPYAPAPPEFRQQVEEARKVPPPKSPRLSGWKNAPLAVPPVPARPPRRTNASKSRPKRSVSSERVPSSNSLAAPDAGLSRSSSTPTIDLPEETAQRLEMYLKKNQSFSSIHILLNELQAQSNIDSALLSAYDSDMDDEHWNATCLDLAGIQLPTSRRHSIEKPDSPGIFVTCDPEDDDIGSGSDLLEEPLPNDTNKGGLSPNSAKNQTPARGPVRLPMIDLRKFSDVVEGDEEVAALPKTPGSWYDQGEDGDVPPSFLSKSLLINLPTTAVVHEDAMVTPPPSENDDLSDEEPLSPVITHSILHKVLRGLRSDDATADSLISRRGSVGNVSLSGLDEFLKVLQVQLSETDEAEVAPTITDLQAALTELLSAEKSNEKQQYLDITVP